MNKILIFGAGKIGRSFLGQLFGSAGYQIVFADVSRSLVTELNRRGRYRVVIKAEREENITISRVSAVHISDEAGIIAQITDADILATAVGKNNLDAILPVIAGGLKRRREVNAGPVDCIIAENIYNAASLMEEGLKNFLGKDFPVSDFIGLIETSIGKMVPIMPEKDRQEDPLQVFAEPYNTLILDAGAFRKPVPGVPGLAPKQNMKAWVDRKLFIHNFGHAFAAYLGFYKYPDCQFLYEALADKSLENEVRQAMQQSGDILRALYPGEFSRQDIHEHIEDLLKRFQNKYLGDTVFRVGSDLTRKLGEQDRFVRPLVMGLEHGFPVQFIMDGMVYSFFFRARDEKAAVHDHDIRFRQILQKGPSAVLTEVCGLDEVRYPLVYAYIQKKWKDLKR